MLRKILAVIMVIVLSGALLVSCSKADSRLIGKWSGTAALYQGSGGALAQRAYCTITFTDDSKAVIELEGQENKSVKWSVDGNNLIFDSDKGVFTLNDNRLVATFNDGQYIEVISLEKK